MPSLQSRLFRQLLRVQRLTQPYATIDGVRRMSRASEFPGKLPLGVTSEIFTYSNLKLEWLTPRQHTPERVLYYLHGGGFVFPMWNPLRRVVAHIANAAKMRALVVHYRLAPEHPYPAAITDCVAGYRWLLSEERIEPQNIAFAGESAGANLVVTTMLALRDVGEPLPGRAVPFCGPNDLDAGGVFNNDVDVMIHPRFITKQILAYRADADPRDPMVSPIYADLRGLPPMLIQVGSREAFLAESITLADRARKAGVDVTLEIYAGMWHYWHLLVPFLPEAHRAIDQIAAFISNHERVQAPKHA